jgi:hypothetical protein
MGSFKRESLLYPWVAHYKRQQSFALQAPEVQFYEYRIDLFGFSHSLNLCVSVELKLTRWRRAVEQALLYQLCSDRAYIALPETTAKRVDLDLLSLHGIGLIAVDAGGWCREVLGAAQSTVVRACYRDAYIDLLQGRA